MDSKFAPSLMCMNLLDIKKQIEFMNQKASLLHVDIMDGHFVRNITLSPLFISTIRDLVEIEIDAHLMVEHPGDFLDAIIESGVDFITPHAECLKKDTFGIISKIKNNGCKFGIALNPATSLDEIKYYIHMLDKITILTIDPGFVGQPFIVEMLDKIQQAKKLKKENGYKYLIEVDGSCNQKHFKELYEAGTEMFIVGKSGLFDLDCSLENAWDKMLEIFRIETDRVRL